MASTRQTKNNQPPGSTAALIVVVAATLAAFAAFFKLPSIALLWFGVSLAAWLEPSVLLTGPRDTATKRPTAASDYEQRRYSQSAFWRSLRAKVIIPSELFVPGKKIRMTFLAGWGTFVLGACLPVSWPVQLKPPTNPATIPQLQLFGHVSNAICSALLVVGLSMAMREKVGPGCPSTTLAHVRALVKSGRSHVLFALAAAVVTAAGLVAARMFRLPIIGELSPAAILFAPLFAAGAYLGSTAMGEARRLWQLRQDTQAEWSPRWEALKIVPEPGLVDVELLNKDQWTLMTWVAPPGKSSADMLRMADKIVATVGSDPQCLIFHAPSISAGGEPVPASIDVTRFRVLLASAGTLRVDDPEMDAGLVALAHEAAMTVVRRANAMEPVAMIGVENVAPDKLGVPIWRSQWNENLLGVKGSSVPFGLYGTLGSDVLVYHRTGGVHEAKTGIYTGELEHPALVDLAPELATMFDNMRLELQWESRWAAGGPSRLKLSPPVAQHPLRATANLRVGMSTTPITRQPFMVRQGIDPRDYFGSESAMRAAMDGSSFVAITGWPAPGDRPGNRHPMALNIYFSPPNAKIPTSISSVQTDKPGRPLSPQQENAEAWLLAGMINTAFDNAKLKRPELITATCLTRNAGTDTVWQLSIRLHDGVTFADVRSKASVLRESFGVPWLRMEPESDGVSIYAGGRPASAKLVRPERDALRLANLDWSQAFVDAKVVNAEGSTPTVVSVSTLENNDSVTQLEITVPSGLSIDRIKGARSKLSPATGNGFIEVRPSEQSADQVMMLVARQHPLPFPAPFDFELAAKGPVTTATFMTGIEGTPIEMDFLDAPHVLFAGTSGSGKSAAAQAMLWPLRVKGMQIAIIDIQKEAADFQFLRDHSLGFATTPEDAAAMIEAIYLEGRRRMKLNADHKVGHVDELPSAVRPPHWMLFMDEFTSAMGKDSVPGKSSDPEIQREISEIEARNAARAQIGRFIGKIARELRSAGIHLVLGTQKLDRQSLEQIPGGSDLKTNLARLLLGNTGQGEKMSALRSPDNAPDLGGNIPKGRGLWEPLSLPRSMAVQCWYAGQGATDDSYKPGTYKYELDQRVAANTDDDRIDFEKFKPKKTTAPGIIGELPPSLRGGAPVIETVVSDETFELDDFDLDLEDVAEAEIVSEETVDLDDLDLDFDFDDEPDEAETIHDDVSVAVADEEGDPFDLTGIADGDSAFGQESDSGDPYEIPDDDGDAPVLPDDPFDGDLYDLPDEGVDEPAAPEVRSPAADLDELMAQIVRSADTAHEPVDDMPVDDMPGDIDETTDVPSDGDKSAEPVSVPSIEEKNAAPSFPFWKPAGKVTDDDW